MKSKFKILFMVNAQWAQGILINIILAKNEIYRSYFITDYKIDNIGRITELTTVYSQD